MGQLNFLIEKGNSIYGNQKTLAQQLGKPDTHISMWSKGKRRCTAPDRAELAAAVGEDPTTAALEAVIEDLDTKTSAGQKAKAALEAALKRVRNLYLSTLSAARKVRRIRASDTVDSAPRHTK